MHVLLLAGPSGAGKSAFLNELRAGRVAPEIVRHLPQGAERWPQCSRPAEYEAFLAQSAGQTGLVIHHDITQAWRRTKHDLASHSIWRVLSRCDAVTLICIRPTRRRLMDHYTRGRLRMPWWQVHARRLLTPVGRLALRIIRPLRRVPHRRKPDRPRYPRPLWFLKYLDRAIRRHLRRHKAGWTGHFDFYRRRGNLERMMRTWEDAAASAMAGLPITRVNLAPDPTGPVGRSFRWRLERVAPASVHRDRVLLPG